MEKHEPGPVPEGYCLSIAYMCLIDCTHSVYSAIEGRNQINNNENLINKTTNVDGKIFLKLLFYSKFIIFSINFFL